MSTGVYVKTFGCQMNVAESERAYGLLRGAGFSAVERLEDADVVIVNTCTVRRHAEDRAESFIGELRRWKQARPGRRILVMGCYAQVAEGALRRRFPFVDAFAGARTDDSLPVLLERFARVPVPVQNVAERHRAVSVFVPVTYGCDNRCSYCIVPFARGPERSRPFAEVLREATELLRCGVRELVLLGQNVNSYRDTDGGVTRGFAELLEAVAVLGDETHRVRFMTSHPRDLSDRIISVIARHDNICPHVHLPLQSGSDAILARMNRGYTVADYTQRAHRIRELIPGVSLTTDLIVGFPGETIADFESTCGLVERLRFDSAFVFKFSPRPLTAAAAWPDDVPGAEKERRHRVLLETCLRMAAEAVRPLIGTEQEVLVERVHRARIMGKTPGNRSVTAETGMGDRIKAGDTVAVRITGVRNHTLVGVVPSPCIHSGQTP